MTLQQHFFRCSLFMCVIDLVYLQAEFDHVGILVQDWHCGEDGTVICHYNMIILTILHAGAVLQTARQRITQAAPYSHSN